MISTREAFEAHAAAGLSFGGETMTGVDLDGFEAEGLDLAESTWVGVRARGAKITASVWSGARLRGVDFQGADLSRSACAGLDA